jgi:hypothetical protein
VTKHLIAATFSSSPKRMAHCLPCVSKQGVSALFAILNELDQHEKQIAMRTLIEGLFDLI